MVALRQGKTRGCAGPYLALLASDGIKKTVDDGESRAQGKDLKQGVCVCVGGRVCG